MKPTVGAVIVTYNSAQYIRRCLASVLGQTYSSVCTVLVDNASVDKTVPTIRKYFKNVHIIKNKTNVGFGAANNIGIRYLLKRNSKYVLLLNPDTIVSPHLLKEFITAFTEDKKILSVSPIITYLKDPKKIWYAGGHLNNLFFYTKHPHMNKNVDDIKILSGITDFTTGACMMIKREAFEKIGFFPEDYFLYFEDMTFCRKICDKGYLCYLLAKPLVKHVVSQTTGTAGSNTMSSIRAYYYARNPLFYIKNNGKGITKFTWFLGQFLIRMPYYFIRILKEADPSIYPIYIKGIVDGIKGKSGKAESL